MLARVGCGYGFDVSITRCSGGCDDHTPYHTHRCLIMYVCLMKTRRFIRHGLGSKVSEKWVWLNGCGQYTCITEQMMAPDFDRTKKVGGVSAVLDCK